MFVTTRALAPRMGVWVEPPSGPEALGASGSRGLGAEAAGADSERGLLGGLLGLRCGGRLRLGAGAGRRGGSRRGGLGGGGGRSLRGGRGGGLGRGRGRSRRSGAGAAAFAGAGAGAVAGAAAGVPLRGRSRCRRRGGWWRHPACSRGRSPTTPCPRCSCPAGTARTARRPATRSARRWSGDRWTGTARPRRMRLFLGSSASRGGVPVQPIPAGRARHTGGCRARADGRRPGRGDRPRGPAVRSRSRLRVS